MTTPRYAAETKVTRSQTVGDIEAVLQRYGATAFTYGIDHGRRVAFVAFEIANRRVRVTLPLPDPEGFARTARQRRTPAQAQAAYEQAERSRWRALLLVLKAKLEAVSSGITTIEREFLADVMLPNGETVGEWLQPQLQRVGNAAEMPALLPGVTRPARRWILPPTLRPLLPCWPRRGRKVRRR